MITTDLKRKTAKDYADLPLDAERCELIDGEYIMTPSPTSEHQDILGYLYMTLSAAIKPLHLGKALFAPLDVFATEYDVYQPDLLFVRQDNISIIKRTGGVYGAPDLIIEVLSPSIAYYDIKTKKAVYERIGVREYWIVDPKDHSVECFENSDRGFVTAFSGKQTGKCCSQVVPQFCIDLQDLFATP